ncbi:BTB/POZ domain-containing protein 6-like [Dendronephthya gigantea]|uniref:BTB/POZ domain-containing protein 6-like n=1 Tax=Dendronephthya gigantea TaxID=151771 RepID=UPI00106CD90C|nr:BTB/POZ domain-containing protein 6-like [Dendronephthya gigantea]
MKMASLEVKDMDWDWQATKCTLLERNRHMLNNPLMSDVLITLEGSEQKFYAHKYVLCTSSSAFHGIFSGGLAEMLTNSLHISDSDPDSMMEFLTFLYTDECNLTSTNIVSVMYLAKKYTVPSLVNKCSKELSSVLEPTEALSILEEAMQYDQMELVEECWEVIESFPNKVIKSAGFSSIRHATLVSLLKRKNLQIPEIELFQAVLKWADYQCAKNNLDQTPESRRNVIGDAIHEIRFLAMTQEEFAQIVSPSRLLSTNEMVHIYEKFNGIYSPALEWSEATREERLRTIVCPKFLPTKVVPKSLSDNTYFFLSFSASKDISLHGVRFYAGPNKVTLYVKKSNPSGSCDSEIPHTNVCAGYVMFPTPVFVNRDDFVMLLAVIGGSSFGYYEWIDKNVLHLGDISINFLEAYLPYNCDFGSAQSEGRFEEVMISVS